MYNMHMCMYHTCTFMWHLCTCLYHTGACMYHILHVCIICVHACIICTYACIICSVKEKMLKSFLLYLIQYKRNYQYKLNTFTYLLHLSQICKRIVHNLNLHCKCFSHHSQDKIFCVTKAVLSCPQKQVDA